MEIVDDDDDDNNNKQMNKNKTINQHALLNILN